MTSRQSLLLFIVLFAIVVTVLLAGRYLATDEAVELEGGNALEGSTVRRSQRAEPNTEFVIEESPVEPAQALEQYLIRGKVVDVDGNAIPFAQVMASYGGSSTVASSIEATDSPLGWKHVEANGEFEFSVSKINFTYCLQARAQGFAIKWLPDVEVRSGNALIVLDIGARLYGQVKDTSGEPIAHAQITYCGIYHFTFFEAATETDLEGKYELKDLPFETLAAPLLGHLRVEATGFPICLLDVSLSRPLVDRCLDITVPQGATFKGRTLDGDDGKVLADVDVEGWSLFGRETFVTDDEVHIETNPIGPRRFCKQLTDVEGRFSISAVPVIVPGGNSVIKSYDPRSLAFVARKPGWASGGIYSNATEKTKEVSIVLWPAGRLKGRAVDESGKPFGGAKLQVSIDSWNFHSIDQNSVSQVELELPGRIWWSPEDRESATFILRTNELGEFLWPFVPTKRGQNTSISIWGKDGIHGFEHRMFEIESGQTTDCGDLLFLRPKKPVKIAGIVSDNEGVPIHGVRIHLNTNSRYDFMATTAIDGTFEFVADEAEKGDTKEEWSLNLYRRGFQVLEEFPLTENGNDHLTIALKRSHHLLGRAVTPSGKPAISASIWIYGPSSDSDDGNEVEGFYDDYSDEVTTGQDGTFSIRGLPDGPYEIHAKGFYSDDDKMLKVEGVQANQEDFVLVLLEEPPVIGSLTVKVVNPTDQALEIFLRPGKYELVEPRLVNQSCFVFDEVPAGMGVLNIASKGMADQEIRVSIDPAEEKQTIEVILQVGASISGVVHFPQETDSPLNFYASLNGAIGFKWEVTKGASHAFHFGRLTPGVQELGALGQHYGLWIAHEVKEVNVAAGEHRKDVVLRAEKGAGVRVGLPVIKPTFKSLIDDESESHNKRYWRLHEHVRSMKLRVLSARGKV
ncbi:MAG: hypothetical protein ACI97A_002890, partial [Planctomycetota bacterium]